MAQWSLSSRYRTPSLQKIDNLAKQPLLPIWENDQGRRERSLHFGLGVLQRMIDSVLADCTP